jgi:tRNA A37 N6-isopentenylltransferase MiaA
MNSDFPSFDRSEGTAGRRSRLYCITGFRGKRPSYPYRDRSHSISPPGPLSLQTRRSPLVAVAGPTGSGKSDLALAIAQQFDGEIINCDSLQVYRHFDIGTAKLPPSERCGVPHHLIDILNPDELFTAGEYARLARETIQAISQRGRLPILAGGTGFYLRALLDGLFEGPSRDQSLRDRLAGGKRGAPARCIAFLHDSTATAQKIHPHDVPKVTRALEVCLLTQAAGERTVPRGAGRACGLSHIEAGAAARS